MKKTVLVTGATAGIGWATAEVLAKNNYKIIICGRRENRLEEFKSQYGHLTDVLTLSFDVRDKQAVFDAINSIPESFKPIDILINNAGNAHGLDPIHNGSIDDWEAMIDINVKGLLYVSRAIIPSMVERGDGHIVNIGSIAGKEAYENGNVYCGSKHAVNGINNGMRYDLTQHGIKVSQVNPGAVDTEFSEVRFKGDKERADNVYKGFEPLVAIDIAELIHFVITRPKHVNISDSIILPLAQPGARHIYRK